MNARMMSLLFAIAVAAVMTAQPVRAEVLIVTDDVLTPEAFPAASGAIRGHLQEGGAYARLADHQKVRVDTFLERIQGYLASGEQRHRPRIGQLQLRVNSILAPEVAGNVQGSEMICRREKTIGSHIPETVCYNRHDLEENARYIQHQIIQIPEPGGTGAGRGPGNPARTSFD